MPETTTSNGAAIARMLRPRSIAIIGATPDTNKLSGRPQHFLTRDGFAGRIYPVNPRYPEIAGIRCYPDIASLPETPDLAIVAVAAARASETVEALGRKGCPAAVVFSSGFGEVGAEGRALEERLVATAKAGGLRICGPNTLGFVNAFERCPATFSQYADQTPLAGPIGFASQSGAFGTGIAALARSRGLGFGYFVSTGNTADMTPIDCLIEMLEDERIEALAGYIEGLADCRSLVALAEKARVKGKPVVLTKVGRRPAGARAAAAHTGSLAGDDRVFDAALRQLGILRARNEEHMLDMLAAIVANKRPAEGNGIAFVTMSGGAGVLMADRAEEIGLVVPMLPGERRERLAAVVPAFGATANPVDVTGQFLADPRLLPESVEIVLADPAVHVAVIWLQLMHGHADRLVALFKQMKTQVTKPFVVCWVEAPETARQEMTAAGIAVISATERAVDAAAGLVAWGMATKAAPALPASPTQDRVALTCDSSPGMALPSMISRQLLESAGIALIATRFAATAADALGYPVVLRAEARNGLGRATIGALGGIATREAVRSATARITAIAPASPAEAAIDGVRVQRMAPPGLDMIVELRRDPAFGHLIKVRIGGALGKVWQDEVLALAPISEADALAMLGRLSGQAILDGALGPAAVHRPALARLIARLSSLAVSHPDIDAVELDPVAAGPGGAVTADWLVQTRPGARR